MSTVVEDESAGGSAESERSRRLPRHRSSNNLGRHFLSSSKPPPFSTQHEANGKDSAPATPIYLAMSVSSYTIVTVVDSTEAQLPWQPG
jgi:hypothetical protein